MHAVQAVVSQIRATNNSIIACFKSLREEYRKPQPSQTDKLRDLILDIVDLLKATKNHVDTMLEKVLPRTIEQLMAFEKLATRLRDDEAKKAALALLCVGL